MAKSQSPGFRSKPQAQNPTAERENDSEQRSGEEPEATPAWWRALILTHEEAEAGGPAGASACGEEDPGSGLEFLVSREDRRKKVR
ncbi:hypothetical protein [Marinimicrobium sp. ABcell2]|uniref:hypothetical protein n=1 Tax=Marinimicrobium sp. ABcell2 TaxID=3069751 RepID=UPI0027B1244C|nr:hypothetical protein [Marinimicrobium sp. ABcell2]MDQ2076691.1 hypothetical protein [Marinimicrobium sp. ABcell2]